MPARSVSANQKVSIPMGPVLWPPGTLSTYYSVTQNKVFVISFIFKKRPQNDGWSEERILLCPCSDLDVVQL